MTNSRRSAVSLSARMAVKSAPVAPKWAASRGGWRRALGRLVSTTSLIMAINGPC